MSEENNKKPASRQATVGSVEADLAFFSARDALLKHQPDTAYKRAQLKVNQAMTQELQAQLEELQIKQKLRQARQSAKQSANPPTDENNSQS